MSEKKTDLNHPIGYGSGEQHLGKAKIDFREDNLPAQAGVRGEPESHVSGQGGPEILGGSASTRVTGQSVNDQLKHHLPTKSDK